MLWGEDMDEMVPVMKAVVGTNAWKPSTCIAQGTDQDQKMLSVVKLLSFGENLKGASGWTLFDGHNAVKNNKNADYKRATKLFSQNTVCMFLTKSLA